MFTKKNRLLKMIAASLAVMGLAACGASTSSPTAVVQPAPAATSVVAPTQPLAPVATQAEATAASPTSATTAPAAESATAAPTKFNLNTATAEQITSAPNTGSRMVREFSEYRPYASILQFRKEIGKYVDAAQLAEYEKYFYVPVVPNTADAATLQQLPGVDAAIADKLIAARPYANPAAFLTKLGELTSPENAAAATSMVEAQ